MKLNIHTCEKIISIILVLGTIMFNLWLYRLEPTAAVDPNDNSFQFALVDRTNAIFDFAGKHCTGFWLSAVSCQLSYLTDHWVPNWAQGYNLPYYYSHLPQILIVGSYKIFHSISCQLSVLSCQLDLFEYYHWIIYILLCFFPLSVFLALRIIKLPWIIAGIGAFTASQLSTDGLYGLDPSSFLWRGYGLSSQLFAMIFLPLAIAYSWKLFSRLKDNNKSKVSVIPAKAGIQAGSPIRSEMTRKTAEQENLRYANLNFWLAVLFLVLTTAGHLGIGIMAILGLIPLAFGSIISELLYDPSCILNRIKTRELFHSITRISLMITLLVGSVVLILSYWIIPVLLHDLYHNTSVWDPVWKFDSYGAKDVLTKLLTGDLFDFGRFPLLTIFTSIGIFGALSGKIFEESTSRLVRENQKSQKNQLSKYDSRETIDNACRDPKIFFCEEQHQSLSAFPFLFLFYLALYFGRTTWGPLIDLIPGMSDFHISRFIVGLHIAGIFLVPIGIWWIASWIMNQVSGLVKRLPRLLRQTQDPRNDTRSHLKTYSSIRQLGGEKFSLRSNDTDFRGFEMNSTAETIFLLFVYFFIGLFVYLLITPQTLEYARHNDRLIKQGNESYAKIADDTEELLKTLKSLLARSSLGEGGGRVYAGRGGNWGKQFRVAETPMFMHISTYGIPTVLWLPETWSPNSDTEQFFSEDRAEDYALYNLQYVVAPIDQKPQSFWKEKTRGKTWILYDVLTDGYITTGYDVARVVSDKFSFVNVIRLWINSDNPKLGLFPRIELKKNMSQSHISSPQSLVSSLPYFSMLDESTYQTPDGKTHSLFQEPPSYSVNPTIIEKEVNTEKYGEVKILSQSSDTDMIFKASVEVSDKCTTCLVILRQTYHPSWVALVDGKRVESFSVFPFFTAIKASPGTHDIVFSYEPSFLKKTLFLLFLGGMSVLMTHLISRLLNFHKILFFHKV